MKTYKHKTTGDVAEQLKNGAYKLNKKTIGLVPAEYIENSSDWEEVVNKESYKVTSIKATDAGKVVAILGVRRLSDYEQFIVGNIVHTKYGVQRIKVFREFNSDKKP
jgi:hypothetical protein